MSNDFFERQRAAHRRTRALSIQFGLLVLPAIIAAFVALAMIGAIGAGIGYVLVADSFAFEDMLDLDKALLPWLAGTAFAAISLPLFMWRRFRRFGHATPLVCRELCAELLTRVEYDPEVNRLLNVVEEMSISAGLPAPAVYVWPSRQAVNAITVGRGPADAGIFVSRGAIDALTRDEMQCLIAYSMSQILNGDMNLNLRIGAYVSTFKIAPRVALAMLTFPWTIGRNLGVLGLILWLSCTFWVGAMLSVVAFPLHITTLFLQSRTGRQRQMLGDAAALQFSRNPDANRSLIFKALAIGVRPAHVSALLDDLAHCYFAAPHVQRFFQIQEPLFVRMRKFVPGFQRMDMLAERRQIVADYEAKLASISSKSDDFVGGVAGDGGFIGKVVSDAALLETLADPRVTLFGLLLERDTPIRARRLEILRRVYGDPFASAVSEARALMGELSPADRSLALDIRLPRLRELSVVELQRLKDALVVQEAAGEDVDVFEYALARSAIVFINALLRPRDPHGRLALSAVTDDLHTLFSVLASHSTQATSAQAFEVGMRRLGLRSWSRYSEIRHWTQALDTAMTRLQKLQPAAKELLLEALHVTVTNDGFDTPVERELVRVIAANLNFPLVRDQSPK